MLFSDKIHSLKSLGISALFLIGALGLSPDAPGQTPTLKNEICARCHGNPSIKSMALKTRLSMVKAAPEDASIRERPDDYADLLYLGEDGKVTGAHAGLNCVDCHSDIDSVPHDQYLPMATCAKCHPDEETGFMKSAHAGAALEGNPLAPRCSDCHGSVHQIKSSKDPESPTFRLNISRVCENCHERDDVAKMTGQDNAQRIQDFEDSIHSKAMKESGLLSAAVCSDCHGVHEILKPSDPASSVSRENLVDTCGKCHYGIKETFEKSIHGQLLADGDDRAPNCEDCHSSHAINEVSDRSDHIIALAERCGNCHERQMKTYETTYHGKVKSLGGTTSAMCGDCHGHHNIQPAEHPDSMIGENHIVATCAECHPKANANFAQFRPHAVPTDRENYPVEFWVWVFMTTLLLSTLIALLTHSFLWFIREIVDRFRYGNFHHGHKESKLYIRYNGYHRLTHLLVIISFMGLTATGIPLRYSYQPWAHTMMNMVGGYEMAGAIHRFCAILSFLYVFMHLGWLAKHWVFRWPKPFFATIFGPDSMIWRPKDFVDAFQHIRWFLFLGERPKFDRWTYWDKLDYWGEFWGMTVIGSTGLMLWFPTFFSQFLPGWFFNLATIVHSIEALLAASVIFLVHFFNVHLRPSKFPLDEVIFSGAMTEAEFEDEHPLEYERLVAEGRLHEYEMQPPSPVRRFVIRFFGISAFLFGLFLVGLIMFSEIQYVLDYFGG